MLNYTPQPTDYARQGECNRPRVSDYEVDRSRDEVREDSVPTETATVWELPKSNGYVDMYVGGWA